VTRCLALLGSTLKGGNKTGLIPSFKLFPGEPPDGTSHQGQYPSTRKKSGTRIRGTEWDIVPSFPTTGIPREARTAGPQVLLLGIRRGEGSAGVSITDFEFFIAASRGKSLRKRNGKKMPMF